MISGVVDTNTIALTLNERYSVPTLVTGIVLAVVVGIIVFGGIGRIGHVCEVVAPFMGGAYILAGLLIIIVHITEVPMLLQKFLLLRLIRGQQQAVLLVRFLFVCAMALHVEFTLMKRDLALPQWFIVGQGE